MAIIQFQNGTRVQFNGTPTPQDVEEVAQRIGITQQTQTAEQPKEKGFFRQLGEGIVKPFAKAAATGVAALRGVAGLGAYGLSSATGGSQQEKQKILQTINKGSEGIKVPLVGQVKPTAQGTQGIKESLGTGLEVGSYFIGGSGAPKAAIQSLKTLGSKAGIKALTPALKYGAKVGAVSGGGIMGGEELAREGSTIGSVAGQTALGTGFGAVGGAAFSAATPVATGVIRIAGNKLVNVGERIGRVAFELEKSTARTLQSYQAAKPSLVQRIKSFVTGKTIKSFQKPVTESETALRQGLMGTEWQIGVQAKKAQKKLWNDVIDPILKKSEIKVKMNTFFDDVEKAVVKENADLSRRNSLLSALSKIKEDFGYVRGEISLSKLQDYKSGWAKFIPQSFYKGKDISGNVNEVRNQLARKAREVIYGALDDGKLKQAYIDYGNLNSLIESGIKTKDHLTDKGAFRQAWEVIVDTLITPVASIGSQVIYRTGKGLEFIGGAGLKKVDDILTKNTLIK